MELHPLCTFFPRLDDTEFADLVLDLRENGLIHPIITHDGLILDGGNRYRACLDAGIEPRYREYDGDDPVAFVLSANLRRRHLSVGQQAAIVSAAQDWARAYKHGGMRWGGQGAALPIDKTPPIPNKNNDLENCYFSVADRAKVSGASQRTQKMADKLVKTAPAETILRVTRGEQSLAAALREQSPSDEQPTSDSLPDPLIEMANSLEESQKEIVRLSELVRYLEDDNRDMRISKLMDRINSLEGLLAQKNRTLAEAQKQAASFGSLLKKIARKLGVEKYSEIVGRLP